MKRKVVLITKDFTPISNGTISCIENIVPILSSTYDLTIITNRQSLLQPKHTFQDNYHVIRFFSFRIGLKYTLRKVILQLNKTRVFRKLKGYLKANRKRNEQSNSNSKQGTARDDTWVAAFTEFVSNKIARNGFEIVLSIGAPFDDFRVAAKLKSRFPQLHLILIQFDLFTQNPETLAFTHHDPLLTKARAKEEMDWLNKADAALVVKEMVDTMVVNDFDAFKSKIVPFNLPGFKKPANQQITDLYIGKGIDLVYAGAFYPDIRNPKVALEVFYRMTLKIPDSRIHFYSRGCDDIVETYREKMPNNLIYHGYQSKSLIDNAIYSNHFLINIGNKTLNQVPSKILEYISTGKPIINFYSVDHDVCSDYLQPYPFHINIDEHEQDLDVLTNQLVDFITKNRNSKTDFEHLSLNYSDYSPQSLCDRLNELIESLSRNE